MSDLRQLYQESILEHHRAPRHARALDAPTHAAAGNNPLCGDRVAITLRVADLPGLRGGSAPSVVDVGCEVQGCALCRASGSIASELVLGRGLEQVGELIEQFLGLALAPPAAPGAPLASAPSSEDAQRIAPLLEVRHFPSRRRCATLPWETLRAALFGSG